MKKLENIERYLTAQAAMMQVRDHDERPKVAPFVTISRQAGAGGHALAEALIATFDQQSDQELFGGWQIFDRQLCEIVAKNPTFTASLSSLLAEEYRTKTNDFFHQMLNAAVDQDVVMNEVFRVVGAVASIGRSIIVGRAGSEVTRGLGPGVSIRLVAPEDVRVQGVAEFYGLDLRSARDEARKLDASRARLLSAHFDADIAEPTRYDAVWNTGQVSVEAIAESIAVMLRHRVAEYSEVLH